VFLFSLQLLSETFLILRRTERDMIKMYTGFHVQYPSLSSDFNETLISGQIFEKYSSSFTKIRPVGAKLFHADGRTDGRADRQTDGQA
jgi:hypothetical protein